MIACRRTTKRSSPLSNKSLTTSHRSQPLSRLLNTPIPSQKASYTSPLAGDAIAGKPSLLYAAPFIHQRKTKKNAMLSSMLIKVFRVNNTSTTATIEPTR